MTLQFNLNPEIPSHIRIFGGGSLLTELHGALPARCLLHEDWWIMVSDCDTAFICTLGKAYSGSEKVCIVAFPDELPTVKALLNAYAIVLDDQLAEEIGHRLP
jgi:hypothetical protein